MATRRRALDGTEGGRGEARRGDADKTVLSDIVCRGPSDVASQTKCVTFTYCDVVSTQKTNNYRGLWNYSERMTRRYTDIIKQCPLNVVSNYHSMKTRGLYYTTVNNSE